MQESLNQFSIGGLVRLAKYILIFTVVIEGVGTTILFFCWQRIYSPIQALYLEPFILSPLSAIPDSLSFQII